MIFPRWATSTHKFPILYYYIIQQNEGIQHTTTPLHFFFTLTASLRQSQRFFYDSTIQYTVALECFPSIGKLPWENSMGHPIQWVSKLLPNKHPKNLFQGLLPRSPFLRAPSSRTPLLGRVYNKTMVQTQLNNNIFESGRSCSTTKTLFIPNFKPISIYFQRY